MSASHRDDVDTPIDGMDTLIDGMDTLIDDVAREMTGVAPRSGFAARVADRIGGADTSAVRRGRPSSWLLAPAAAAAVLLLAMFIVRETRDPAGHVADRGPAAPVAPLRPDAAPPAILRSTPDAKAATSPAAGGPAATSRITRAPTSASSPDPDLAPLIVPPMAVDRLDVSPLARGDAIEINAIAIERIDITAMP